MVSVAHQTAEDLKEQLKASITDYTLNLMGKGTRSVSWAEVERKIDALVHRAELEGANRERSFREGLIGIEPFDLRPRTQSWRCFLPSWVSEWIALAGN